MGKQTLQELEIAATLKAVNEANQEGCQEAGGSCRNFQCWMCFTSVNNLCSPDGWAKEWGRKVKTFSTKNFVS